MQKEIKLFDLTKNFVIDFWGLERDVDAIPHSEEIYKFPVNEAKIEATKIIFDIDQIRVKSFAWEDKFIRFESDKMTASFNDEVIMAADPNFFEYVLANIAMLATVASMGWDTERKFGEYTRARVKLLVEKNRKPNGANRSHKS